jgi:hypothetical protein
MDAFIRWAQRPKTIGLAWIVAGNLPVIGIILTLEFWRP